nr:MAG TPA: hypothetical protein [Caudoviricetes sp.]
MLFINTKRLQMCSMIFLLMALWRISTLIFI